MNCITSDEGLHRPVIDMISDKELYHTFRREYPKDLAYVCITKEVSPYDLDRRIVIEKFQGQRWESIHADVLQECFDVACNLNPQAFHYFFPAFIRQSQANVEKTSLLVDSLINMLANGGIHWPETLKDAELELLEKNPEIKEALDSTNEANLIAWQEDRWKLFSEQQWKLIQRWLNWIAEGGLEVDQDTLLEAMTKVESRLRKT